MYTFVENKELNNLFLSQIKNVFPECTKINESSYSLKCIDIEKICNEVRRIYNECIRQYPSHGKDYVCILFAAALQNINGTNKDRIVEMCIIG